MKPPASASISTRNAQQNILSPTMPASGRSAAATALSSAPDHHENHYPVSYPRPCSLHSPAQPYRLSRLWRQQKEQPLLAADPDQPRQRQNPAPRLGL